MRTKRPRIPDVPERYIRFEPADWPSWGAWVAARERWAAEQPEVVVAGSEGGPGGRSWCYTATVLGDACDLYRDRREARMLSNEARIMEP